MPTLSTAETQTIAAIAGVVNLLLLVGLILVTKGYADSTSRLAKDTQRLAEVTAASVQQAEKDRSSRRAGLLRAVAAEAQGAGMVGRLVASGSSPPRRFAMAVLRQHLVELASVVEYDLYFEAWHFGETVEIVNGLWSFPRASLTNEVRDDFDLITRTLIADSEALSAILITAVDKPSEALSAARALKQRRLKEVEERFARLRAERMQAPPPPSKTQSPPPPPPPPPSRDDSTSE
jgi:hypothetical protein